jgi:putative flavoprotein involved in K+ transport
VERIPVAVVGAGQAGLAVSHELAREGVEHVVLERGRVGETWRARWESFCLVTPNWTVQLPGGAYDGVEPDGYMPRDDIFRFLERYADAFAAPVRERVDVTGVDLRADAGFVLRTSAGELGADALVVATGTYCRPHLPPAAATLPAGTVQLTVDEYRSPEALPDGAVLVVGSGQSGCQIAEELCEAGREVVLACGRAPWAPRRFGGHDLLWWALESGFLDVSVEALPGPEARLAGNVIATGRDGGHDLHLRVLREQGVTLAGRFVGASDGRALFAADLAESVAWGDDRYRDLARLFGALARERGLELGLDDPPPFYETGPEELDLRGLGAVVFTSGFRPDYTSWLPWPEAFGRYGFPVQRDGESTVVAGLFFVGVHFLRTRKSSLLVGVADDAAIVAGRIAANYA